MIRNFLILIFLIPSFGFAGAADDNLKERVNRLEAGVKGAEAIRAVKRLQHAFSHYLDSGLWSDLGDLFTDNAIGEFQKSSIKGKSSLRRHFMEQSGRASLGLAKGQLHSRLILQPIITLGNDGITAKGTWHEIALSGQFKSSAHWSGGVYENEYALEKGVWKISRICFFPQYSGAYDDWGHKAPPRWDIPYHFDAAHVGVTIPETALRSLAVDASLDPLNARISAVAQRVRQLNDETQVQNLQHSYGYYLDRKMWDDVADLPMRLQCRRRFRILDRRDL
jgi:hypothetical protein